MGKEQTGLLAALWHYMSEHFCVPVFTHFACRYYTSRQELASQEPLPGHSPLFELGPAIQRLGLGCMPLAPTPFQMTTTTTTISITKNITTVSVTKNTNTTTTTTQNTTTTTIPTTKNTNTKNTSTTTNKHKQDNHHNQNHTFKWQSHHCQSETRKGPFVPF